MPRKNITGEKYHRLTAIKDVGSNQQGRRLWLCKCDCGEKAIIDMSNWKKKVKSCGCLSKEIRKAIKTTHGKRFTRVYYVWNSMKQRCLNPNSQHYSYYGGRGISIDEKWLKFDNFYADMGDPPKGLTLDRINNDGNYCKENCRWASRSEQNKNKRQPERNKLGQYVKINGDSD